MCKVVEIRVPVLSSVLIMVPVLFAESVTTAQNISINKCNAKKTNQPYSEQMPIYPDAWMTPKYMFGYLKWSDTNECNAIVTDVAIYTSHAQGRRWQISMGARPQICPKTQGSHP